MFCLFFFFISLAYGQKSSNEISIIKDSIVCKGNTQANYSYINLNNVSKYKSINNYLLNDIKEMFDADSGVLSIDEILTKHIASKREQCDKEGMIKGLITYDQNIIYQNKSFVGVHIFAEYFAGNITTTSDYVSFNLKTDQVMTINQIFEESKILSFSEKCNEILQKTIEFDKEDWQQELTETAYKDYITIINTAEITVDVFKTLEFLFTKEKGKEGLRFFYTVGFDYININWEPYPEIFFTFEELKPYLKNEVLEQLAM
ncbi:hypothetical protein [Aquimarina sp. 433]